jgi:nucleoside-diphosphate-sugar epimerase
VRYIVTGSGGFIGSHLVDRLLKETDTERVYAIDPEQRHVWLDPRVWTFNQRVQEVEYREQFRSGDVDVVFHLAGHVGPTGVLEAAGKIV